MNLSDGNSSTASRQPGINWLVFFSVLLAPLLASCIAGSLDKSNGGVSPLIALTGGGAAGIFGGVVLGRRLGKTAGSKIVWGIVFAIALTVVCVGLNCFGCLASGYQLRF